MSDSLYRCTRCREQKPRTEFYGNPGKPAGRSSWCKPCARESSKVKSQARRDAWREKTKDWPKAKRGRPRKPRTAVLEPFMPKVRYHKPKTSQKPRKPPKKRRVHRIRAMSQEKREWNDLYKEMLGRETLFGHYYDIMDHADGRYSIVRMTGSRHGCEPHHPLGRHKYKILVFRWVTPQLHRQIHDLGHWARCEGLIMKELEGRNSESYAKDPFSVLSELEQLKQKYEA